MRLIDADALYERLKADEELARDRVIDTPSGFPNGAVNPSAIRYMAQLSERTRFKEIVFDAPTIERKKGEWIKMPYHVTECSECGFSLEDWIQGAFYNYCPNCGSDMRGEEE